MTAPRRKRDIWLAAGGLLAGFGVTLGVLAAVRNGHPPATGGTVIARSGHSRPMSPAALDAEWLALSGRSTCADWAGGDGVSAVRLNASQLAWFFADSYLGPAGPKLGFAHLTNIIHNTVVVQTTASRQSKFVTLTAGGACTSKRAKAVVSPPAGPEQKQRYWDADGIRVGGEVLKFYNRYLPGPPPFRPAGTAIASFAVSGLATAGGGQAGPEVLRPRLTLLPGYTPPGGGTMIVWGSALLRMGATVYIYGWQSPDLTGPHTLYLARVSATRLADFAAWRFYAGSGRWAAGQASARPVQPASMRLGVAGGFSVVRLGGRYWLIQQAVLPGDPDIDAYPAPAPWGPFNPASGIVVYRSPDIGLNAAHGYRIMYEARAEPALSTRNTLVISYNVNSVAVTSGCVPMRAYTNTVLQPRFIAVPRTAFRIGPASVDAAQVTAGPSPYPPLVQRDPSQWHLQWNYVGGCPPVPAVSGLTARAAAGSARLEWPSAGLGLRYRIYRRRPGTVRWVLVREVLSPGATVAGLARGTTYEFRVEPVNLTDHVGPGAEVTIRIR